jgi:hypothetical protein
VCTGGVGGYEVSIQGNYVNGKAIAAQISVGAPVFVELSTGYIESIDLSQGTLKIRGGPIVRINDPNGVFGRVYNPKDLFMADDESPSIVAFSGFPMCIPRSTSADPLCPSTNRPSGTSNFQAPDPLVMAPLLAGDYIEYSGIVRGSQVLAWSIVALNVQITTTASSTVPNYIRMEDAIIGVFDTAANVETADIRVSDSSVCFELLLIQDSSLAIFLAAMALPLPLTPSTSIPAREPRRSAKSEQLHQRLAMSDVSGSSAPTLQPKAHTRANT